MTMTIRDVRERFAETVIGKRLRTSEIAHQTAPNFIALAVLASDAMSSVAYATEEILIILNTAAISGFALVGFQGNAIEAQLFCEGLKLFGAFHLVLEARFTH